jgi:hypothetical protein
MNIVLWIVAGLLAAAFLMAGALKVSRPKEKLLANTAWWRTSRRVRSRRSAPVDSRRPGWFRATMNPSVRVSMRPGFHRERRQ